MKITFESGETKTTIECPDALDIRELGVVLYNLCLTQTWTEGNLNKIFNKDFLDD